MLRDFEDGIKLIDKAEEKTTESKMFLRWIPYQETISFNDFKNGLYSSVKKESKEKILNKVKGILDMKVGE
ncbi:MAG: hypothetical protein K0R07_170 [Sedimentibacter sp.]|jgi:hypothetical protein|nr:hypothetical protein [Sedimentibacter sp.]